MNLIRKETNLMIVEPEELEHEIYKKRNSSELIKIFKISICAATVFILSFASALYGIAISDLEKSLVSFVILLSGLAVFGGIVAASSLLYCRFHSWVMAKRLISERKEKPS